MKINILLSNNALLAKKYILQRVWDDDYVGSFFVGLRVWFSLVQKFFKLAKERNCLASINDTNGDWGIQEAEGLKNATSSFIPALLPWSLGPIDEVGGSMVVGVLISSPRRPSKRKNFLIIIQFTELQSSNFSVPVQKRILT